MAARERWATLGLPWSAKPPQYMARRNSIDVKRAVDELVRLARKQGFVTTDDVALALPMDEGGPDDVAVDELYTLLAQAGVEPRAGEVWQWRDQAADGGTVEPDAPGRVAWYARWLDQSLVEWIEGAAPAIAREGPSDPAERAPPRL